MLLAGVSMGSAAWAETVRGTINTISGNQISLTDEKGKLRSVLVNPVTKLKGIGTLTDLHAGANVQIKAKNKNGILEAKSIKAKK